MPSRTRRSLRKTGRRSFLKTVTAGAGAIALPAAPALGGTVPPGVPSSTGDERSSPTVLDYPRAYTGPQLKMISFPLGGIGAGSLSLGGRDNCAIGRSSIGRRLGTLPSTLLRQCGRRRVKPKRWLACWKREYCRRMKDLRASGSPTFPAFRASNPAPSPANSPWRISRLPIQTCR